jgi:wobble nucleotide-excising tRNase
MAYTLQNQMTTTMTAALKKKQELERELTVAHKTITNLSENVKVLEGTHC